MANQGKGRGNPYRALRASEAVWQGRELEQLRSSKRKYSPTGARSQKPFSYQKLVQLSFENRRSDAPSDENIRKTALLWAIFSIS